VRNVVEHLADRGDLPELIVVAVAYPEGLEGDGWLRRYRTQRTRDYTPTFSKTGYPDGVQDVSGGGETFLGFLETRLIPHVDQRFRTEPRNRTIVGHSYGGLFAGYAALTKPALFSQAIMISPSLWYDNHFLFRHEKSRRRDLKNSALRLFLAAGSLENAASEGDIAGDIKRFTAIFRPPDYKAADVRAVVFPDETHNSVFPAAVTRGLREMLGASKK
jgi:predicted alpha/beta superfamily hydrolase